VLDFHLYKSGTFDVIQASIVHNNHLLAAANISLEFFEINTSPSLLFSILSNNHLSILLNSTFIPVSFEKFSISLTICESLLSVIILILFDLLLVVLSFSKILSLSVL